MRLLADTISTLPWHVYRRTEQGGVPAGENARIVQLLKRPSPGSTVVDLRRHGINAQNRVTGSHTDVAGSGLIEASGSAVA